MLISNKNSVIYLLSLCKQLNISEVVCCPGSRNLPLTISFSHDPFFQCTSVLDERTAGFIALGKVKASQKPVLVITTSGSAAINLGPAMAEAYYQHLPLIAITADRPASWINKGENQTIKQLHLFSNFVQLEWNIEEDISLESFEKQVLSLYHALYKVENRGNIHINMPFSEPLMDWKHVIGDFQFQLPSIVDKQSIWNGSECKGKNIILYISSNGLSENDFNIVNQLIDSFQLIVISDIHSNYFHPKAIKNIDYILSERQSLPKPDILITYGEQMLSKKMRQYIKQCPIRHIDISIKAREWNMLSIDYHCIKMSLTRLVESLQSVKFSNSKSFFNAWQSANQTAIAHHHEFFDTLTYSEFSIINAIVQGVEDKAVICWGNSSIIRYANWSAPFSDRKITHLANRGVSGIDGVLSTAIGYQSMSDKPIYCILGDLSLLYEGNALQCLRSHSKVKIIVLNNQGGKIFENIHDLSVIQHHDMILTPHQYSFDKLAQFNDIQYFNSKNLESFLNHFEQVQALDSSCIFEVEFPKRSNDDWKRYFYP